MNNKFPGKRKPAGNKQSQKPWTPESDEPNFNLMSEIDEYGIRKSKSKKYIEKEHKKYGYSVDIWRGNSTPGTMQSLPNVEKVWRPEGQGTSYGQRTGGQQTDRYGQGKSGPNGHPNKAGGKPYHAKGKVSNGQQAKPGPGVKGKFDPRKKNKPVKGVPVQLKPGEIRLNKFLSQQGIASRRKADELIESGQVSVNGVVVRELGARVFPAKDAILVNGLAVSTNPENHYYLIMNKPKDTITTRSDERNRKTVMDLVEDDLKTKLVPVGRLDRDTTGVLLLSNHGELIHRLTHPSYEIPRTYHVTLSKKVLKKDLNKMASGITIDEELMTVSDCGYLDEGKKDIFVVLKEGKNREIRRIFENLGYEVEKLDRVNFAGITTEGVDRGEYRSLNKEEVNYLLGLTALK